MQSARHPVARLEPQGLRHSRHQPAELNRPQRLARLHPHAQSRSRRTLQNGGRRRPGGALRRTQRRHHAPLRLAVAGSRGRGTRRPVRGNHHGKPDCMDSDGGGFAAHLVPGRARLPARRDPPDRQRRQATQRVHRPVPRRAMIAGVKGSAVLSALLMKGSAFLSALLILLPWDAWAADDMAGAIRDLARKTVAFAGRGEPVSVSWRNLSSLASGDFNQARNAFDTALREAGARPSEIAPVVDARLTVSGNLSQFLIVEEARKGDDRQVWIASWKRPAPTGAPAGSILTLEKKLVWEQEEQILDVVMLGPGILVLSPFRVSLHADAVTQSPVSYTH